MSNTQTINPGDLVANFIGKNSLHRLNIRMFYLLFMGFIISHQYAFAQVPAGLEIVNQASIYYKDESGLDRMTTTNLVILTVQQVFSATLEGDRNLLGAGDSEVLFFHTIENTGNGTDLFCVQIAEATGDSGDYALLQAIHDLDRNGQFDPDEPILATTTNPTTNTLSLDAQDRASILVIGLLPSSVTAGDTYKAILTVQAQEGTGICQSISVLDLSSGKGEDSQDDTNHDTATITSDAILEVTKQSTYNENGAGSNDDTITYSIYIKNTGTVQALDVTVQDDLPSDTTFSAGSISTNGTWQSAPIHNSGSPGSINGTVGTLAADTIVSVTYTVDINDNLDGGSTIVNTAQAQGDLDSNGGTDDPVLSNQTLDTFPVVYGVAITDTGIDEADGVNDGGDDDTNNPAKNDDQIVNAVSQGEVVLFKHIVTNESNTEDTINLKATSVSFPSGTTFFFYKENGNIALLDTNGDGIIDTGPMERDITFTILVKAILPTDASGAGPYAATISATSSADPSKTDTTTETLETIITFKTDLANSSGASGFNDDGSVDADPVSVLTTTLSADPGESVTFDLYVANEGIGPDTYSLSSWSDSGATNPLPTGWSVVFKNTAGQIITSTPSLDPTEEFHYIAVVNLPASNLSPTQTIYFKISSTSTGVSDIKQDAVTINDIENISLTPDQTGRVIAGSTIEYVHLLKNTGTTSEDVIVFVESQSHLSNTLLLPTDFSGTEPTAFKAIGELTVGSTVAIFQDSTGTWQLVSLVSDGATGLAIPMDPKDSTHIKLRVQAATSVPETVRDILILRAQVKTGSAWQTNQDQTTVTSGYLKITKLGALDTNCDSTPETGFVTGNLKALPGECVVWQLVVKNHGVETVCQVTVYDAAPSFTQLRGTPVIHSEPAPGGTGSCNVSDPDIECTLGNAIDINGDSTDESFCLRAGEQGEIRFGVKLD